jgi:hypothetical protein
VARQLTPENRFDTSRFFSKLDVIGDLPELSADFSHVSEFLLVNSSGCLRAGRFLERFPNLQFLTMRGVRLEPSCRDLSDAITHLPDARELQPSFDAGYCRRVGSYGEP